VPALGVFLAHGGGDVGIIENRRVDFAIGEKRAGIALFDAQLQFPQQFARQRVHRHKIADLAGHIHTVAHQDGRTGGGAEFIVPQFHLRARHNDRIGRVGGRDVRNLQADHLARLIRRAVNGDDLVVLVQQDRGVDARLENGNLKDRLPVRALTQTTAPSPVAA
jgi:hypothetical protein